MLRVGIAFATLSALFLLMKIPFKLPLRTSALLWLQGLIAQGVAFILLFWGEQYIAPALASIINSMVPIWVLLINGLILRQKKTFTLKKTLGIILGFLGIFVIFEPLLSIQKNMMTLLGGLSVTGMAIAYAVGAILYQRLFSQAESINFKASIWHQHLGSFVFLFFFSIFSNEWPQQNIFSTHLLNAWLAILYLGVFSTAFAWMIYSYLILKWGTIRAVSVLYIVPVFAIVWDTLFLHINMHFYDFLGITMILLGVFFVQRSSSKQPIKV